MSTEETEGTIRRYLDALLNGGDFAAHFADEVVWTTMETGRGVVHRHPKICVGPQTRPSARTINSDL